VAGIHTYLQDDILNWSRDTNWSTVAASPFFHAPAGSRNGYPEVFAIRCFGRHSFGAFIGPIALGSVLMHGIMYWPLLQQKRIGPASWQPLTPPQSPHGRCVAAPSIRRFVMTASSGSVPDSPECSVPWLRATSPPKKISCSPPSGSVTGRVQRRRQCPIPGLFPLS
jgi:hypothetical protein